MNKFSISCADHSKFYEEMEKFQKVQKERNYPYTGVYILKSEIPVPRVNDEDKEGILYIGEGAIFAKNNRPGLLINTLHSTAKSNFHQVEGYKYIKEKYPLATLTLEIELTEDCENKEKELLNKYLAKFGELPPLNRRV